MEWALIVCIMAISSLLVIGDWIDAAEYEEIVQEFEDNEDPVL